jgi:predicted dehydrogenase
VHVNYVQRPPVHRLEIVGTNGTLRWDNADGILYFYRMPAPFGSYSDTPPAPVVETFSPPEGFERNDLFLAQTRHFLNVARGTESPVCTLEDGIRIQKLVQAARESEAGGHRIEL